MNFVKMLISEYFLQVQKYVLILFIRHNDIEMYILNLIGVKPTINQLENEVYLLERHRVNSLKNELTIACS